MEFWNGGLEEGENGEVMKIGNLKDEKIGRLESQNDCPKNSVGEKSY